MVAVETSHVVLFVVVAGIVGFALGRRRHDVGTAPHRRPRPDLLPPPPATPPPLALPTDHRQKLLAHAQDLGEIFHVAAHPVDLETYAPFRACVALLASPTIAIDELFGYLVGDNSTLSCAAAEALRERQELLGDEASLVPRLRGISIYSRFFLLRTIARSSDPSCAFDVLLQADPSWGSAMGVEVLRSFLLGRLEVATVQRRREELQRCPVEQSRFLQAALNGFDDPGAAAALAVFSSSGGAVDLARLRSCARILEPKDTGPTPLPSPTQEACRRELESALQSDRPRSLLLVGEAGVGKSTVISALVRGLLETGWVVFEAGATQLLAGQSFIGQLEQRLQDLLAAVGGRRQVLWLVPDLPDLVYAGRTTQSRVSILDQLLPHLLSGHLRLLAPLSPASCEQLLRSAPALRTAAVTVRLPACGSEETLAIARAWLHETAGVAPRLCDDELLHELHGRAQQHLTQRAAPGALLQLLALLRERVQGPDAPSRTATLDDAIQLLGRLTGLPPAVLDERDGLDLDNLRRAFAARVMGQPDAVDCLVERIAMLKAGLCDPRRPVGVFLFTGPTGTGKTELCRVLAAYLFGSAERMLRFDMSEFQHPESLGRLIGDVDELQGRPALVHRIREQPFAVILFDEIEKAHSMVFDLFLQLFDEGRLTDRRGQVADFRHAIVIMTSNLGVRSLEGTGLGFGERGPDLQRALEEVFRREFLNRVDRIVVFRSLDRPTMRQVLQKELDAVLQRRGLRHRQWAIEWDESALRFLLDEGWSTTLGARPLRRAIERHVLAPLAAAIVSDRLPAGDQFLFVRSDGRGLHVEFVDPDAPVPEVVAAQVSVATADLRALARDGTGRPEELARLGLELEQLDARIAEPAWTDRKAAAYAAMSESDFWSSPRRHAVLGVAELMDRIEVAVRTAARRATHWCQRNGDGAGPDAEATRELATRALLLQLAIAALDRGEPADAYLVVQPVHDPLGDRAHAVAFARELWSMYSTWSRRRGMDWRELDEHQGRTVIAVAGFAAHSVLAGEAGLHVLEPESKGARAVRVRVAIAPQPPAPADDKSEPALASAAIDAALGATPAIVRRYRRGPSPEVRDRRRGWRTGRWDRVLGGEFDVMA